MSLTGVGDGAEYVMLAAPPRWAPGFSDSRRHPALASSIRSPRGHTRRLLGYRKGVFNSLTFGLIPSVPSAGMMQLIARRFLGEPACSATTIWSTDAWAPDGKSVAYSIAKSIRPVRTLFNRQALSRTASPNLQWQALDFLLWCLKVHAHRRFLCRFNRFAEPTSIRTFNR